MGGFERLCRGVLIGWKVCEPEGAGCAFCLDPSRKNVRLRNAGIVWTEEHLRKKKPLFASHFAFWKTVFTPDSPKEFRPKKFRHAVRKSIRKGERSRKDLDLAMRG